MHINQYKKLYSIVTFIVSLVLSNATLEATPPISTIVEGEYREVRNNVADAIRSKGLNIANILHASDMLNRTGSVFGVKSNAYNNAEIFEFCSAKISHAISQANHQNILLCPFKIAVYNLAADPKNVHIVYDPPIAKDEKSTESVAKIEELIKSIVEEATF